MSRPNKALLLSLIPKVQELLAEPTKWGKGAMGRDVAGKEVASDSAYACSWCLYGAIVKACKFNSAGETLIFNFLSRDREVVLYIPPRLSPEEKELYAKTGMGSLIDYNDAPERTHAEILALLERALTRAKALPDEPAAAVSTPPAPPQEASWVDTPV